MNAQIKAAWINLLKNGPYNQCKHVWFRSDSASDSMPKAYCAAGLAGKAAGLDRPMGLPIQDTTGLTADQITQLAKWNDFEGKTFPEIARLVEGW